MNKTTSRQPLLVYIEKKKIVFWFLDGYKQKKEKIKIISYIE